MVSDLLFDASKTIDRCSFGGGLVTMLVPVDERFGSGHHRSVTA